MFEAVTRFLQQEWVGITSVAALIFSVYNFYVNRRDKKPRLKVTVEGKEEELAAEQDEQGEFAAKPVKAIVIHAANPTERQIAVSSIEYEVNGRPAKLPLFQGIPNIPSHEKRKAIIIAADFYSLLGNKSSGRFVITDALGNKHKSKKVKIER